MPVTFIQSGRFGSGAFDPTSISGCKLWLDASDAATITFGTGQLVAQWDDKSGSGWHAVQATAGQQPIRDTTQNSLATINFPSSDYFYCDSVTAVAQPLTIFVVGKNTTPTTGSRGRTICTSTGFQTCQGDGSATYRTAIVYAGGADFAKGPADAYSTTVWGVSSYVINGASTIAYVDGAAGSAFDAGSNGLGYTSSSGHYYVVGVRGDAGLELHGEIAEIIVYDTALSSGNRGTVEAYLKAKWGTP